MAVDINKILAEVAEVEAMEKKEAQEKAQGKVEPVLFTFRLQDGRWTLTHTDACNFKLNLDKAQGVDINKILAEAEEMKKEIAQAEVEQDIGDVAQIAVGDVLFTFGLEDGVYWLMNRDGVRRTYPDLEAFANAIFNRGMWRQFRSSF